MNIKTIQRLHVNIDVDELTELTRYMSKQYGVDEYDERIYKFLYDLLKQVCENENS